MSNSSDSQIPVFRLYLAKSNSIYDDGIRGKVQIIGDTLSIAQFFFIFPLFVYIFWKNRERDGKVSCGIATTVIQYFQTALYPITRHFFKITVLFCLYTLMQVPLSLYSYFAPILSPHILKYFSLIIANIATIIAYFYSLSIQTYFILLSFSAIQRFLTYFYPKCERFGHKAIGRIIILSYSVSVAYDLVHFVNRLFLKAPHPDSLWVRFFGLFINN